MSKVSCLHKRGVIRSRRSQRFTSQIFSCPMSYDISHRNGRHKLTFESRRGYQTPTKSKIPFFFKFSHSRISEGLSNPYEVEDLLCKSSPARCLMTSRIEKGGSMPTFIHLKNYPDSATRSSAKEFPTAGKTREPSPTAPGISWSPEIPNAAGAIPETSLPQAKHYVLSEEKSGDETYGDFSCSGGNRVHPSGRLYSIIQNPSRSNSSSPDNPHRIRIRHTCPHSCGNERSPAGSHGYSLCIPNQGDQGLGTPVCAAGTR
jgi:hypothetical protein